jgi:hypothetical protein
MQDDVERVVALIERELDVQEMVLTDPMTLRRLKAQRIARAAMAATLELAAEALRELAKVRQKEAYSDREALVGWGQETAADWLQQRAKDVKGSGNG